MSHPFPTVSTRIGGADRIAALSLLLIQKSQWFEVTPLPEDEYELVVKPENESIIRSHCRIQTATHAFSMGSATYAYLYTGRRQHPALGTLKKQFDIDFEPDGETINCEDVLMSELKTLS